MPFETIVLRVLRPRWIIFVPVSACWWWFVTATVEHEATTSRIGDDQLFYCRQRGLSEEDAVSMIVNGFCKEVFRELPMEFAVEAQNLLGLSLEGAVG